MENEDVINKMNDIQEALDDVSDSSDEEAPREDLINDENEPITQANIKDIAQLVKTTGEMVQIMTETWEATKREFDFTDNNMKDLYQYNEQHRDPMPDNLTDEEKEEWDRFNGIWKMTQEEAIEILGEDHKAIGMTVDITHDRLHEACESHFGVVQIMTEYKQINQSYQQLMEISEEANITKLKEVTENETDPEKKAKMQKSIDDYYYIRYLDFINDVDDKRINRLLEVFVDEHRVSYYLKRTRKKLDSLKISQKFILEISQFEKRFIEDSKYEDINNMTLLYFMSLVTYGDILDPHSKDRTKVMSMIFALDGIVQGNWKDEKKDRVLTNIRNFLDRVLEMKNNKK